uniref:Uncharacterized protein n=1 Tax=Sinocyclocheilus anshuiensis TaxID=1608454 RepID=A0A671QVL1_9TELE
LVECCSDVNHVLPPVADLLKDWPLVPYLLDQGTIVQLVSYREVVFVLSCQFGVTGHDTHRVTQTRSNEQPLMIAWSLCTSVLLRHVFVI